MTAQSVVREREVGTIEQLLVTPIRPLELLLGKIAPKMSHFIPISRGILSEGVGMQVL